MVILFTFLLKSFLRNHLHVTKMYRLLDSTGGSHFNWKYMKIEDKQKKRVNKKLIGNAYEIKRMFLTEK